MAGTSSAAELTDTEILIDAMRGLADAVTFSATQRTAGGCMSIISAVGLVAGCRNATELAQLRQFLRKFAILPVSVTVSQTAYQLKESFPLSHELLVPNALIAATALELTLTLYTKNRRHLQTIPVLTLVRHC